MSNSEQPNEQLTNESSNGTMDFPLSSTKAPDVEMVGEFSFGAAMGVASGYVLRQGGKVMAATVGTGFVFLQTLSHFGYVDVKWDRLQADYRRMLDTDGDGRITTNDLNSKFDRLEKELSHNLPSGSGFASGLAYGLSGSLKAAGVLGGIYGVGGLSLRDYNQGLLGNLAGKVRDVLPDNLKSNSNNNELGSSEQVEANVFAAGLVGRPLDDLRLMESEYKSLLIAVGPQSEGGDKLHNMLMQIEDAKVEAKRSGNFRR